MLINKNSNYDLLKKVIYDIGLMLNHGLPYETVIDMIMEEYKDEDILEFLEITKSVPVNSMRENKDKYQKYISNTYINIILENSIEGNIGNTFINISKNMNKCKYVYDEYFMFLNNMVLLLNYGYPINSAINEAISDISSIKIKKEILQIEKQLNSGKSVSECISGILDKFNTHYKIILNIAEDEGRYIDVLNDILNDMFKQHNANMLKDIIFELNS